MTADFIDDRSGVVLLLFGRKPLTFVEHKSRLCSGFAFLRLWDRCDEFGTASALNDFLRGLPSFIKLPIPHRAFVGRVQYWMVKERVRHNRRRSLAGDRNRLGADKVDR